MDETARQVEYINAMIDWARDDVSRVHVRVTGAVGVAVLFITQLPFDKLAALDKTWTVLLFVGLVCLLLGAGFHFQYSSRIHRSRRELARCLPKADGAEAGHIWRQVWEEGRPLKGKSLFTGGDLLIVAGVLVLGVVLGALLALPA